jgi:general stress protein YciG
VVSKDREHMAKIGRIGGQARAKKKQVTKDDEPKVSNDDEE